MDPAVFRAAAHAVVDLMADYLATIEDRAVFPALEPGSLRSEFPPTAPDTPEALDAILTDYERLIPASATHWQHPGFMAYFPTTASGPGVLGEMLINEYQAQLGRRFRALKLWIQLRWFGLEGLRRRIERHIEVAHEFASWIDGAPEWERLAPAPFSTVCFRWNPGSGTDREAPDDATLDALNAAIMDAVNRQGDIFLSHTRLDGRFTIRLSVGNLRTEPRHVERAWALLRQAAAG